MLLHLTGNSCVEKNVFYFVSHTAHKHLLHIPQSIFFCFIKSFFPPNKQHNNIHVNLEVLIVSLGTKTGCYNT